MTFVKYSCGCVGIPFYDQGEALLFFQCDAPRESPNGTTLHVRDMDGKTSEPLTPEKAMVHVRNVGDFVGQGFSFQEIKRLLGN